MRVLVCGGRNFGADVRERNAMWLALDDLCRENTVDTIVHGGATGADFWAGEYARRNGIAEEVHHAQWSIYGGMAGPIRNTEMIKSGVDIVVACPGGRGTADTCRKARNAGIPIIKVMCGTHTK